MNELGRFITNGTKNPFYARKVFYINKNVKKAHAKVCGLGQFVFYINGKKVDDHELDPGWTDYRKSIQYVTFDITEYLHPGKNCIGTEVGNGWFILNTEHYTFTFPGFMPDNPNPYKPFANSLMLAMRIEVEFEDESSIFIEADDSFRVKEHFIKYSNVYGSEMMDARLIQRDFSTAEFDDKEWKSAEIVDQNDVPSGKLTKQFQPPVKVIKRYTAKKCGEIDGREIYDLGQNISGMLQITICGKNGDAVKIYPAEKLAPNGDIDQVMKGWTTVDTVITCILGERKTETFRSRFTYFAGRYLAIEKSAPNIIIEELIGDAISSAWKTSGHFKISDRRYEQIYDLVEKAVEANMVSVHTDCPTIERFAWQEPNHLMAPSIMFMKDGNYLWRKFFSDMRDSQHNADDYFYDYDHKKVPAGDGLIPSQCPCYIPNVLPVPGMGSFYDIIPWGSALILGVKWHYLFYGDIDVIRENFDASERYFSYLKTKMTKEGFINHGLGDWGNPDNELARENIETAFLYADATALSYFSQLLGYEDKAFSYEKFADSVKENYNNLLLKEGNDGEYYYVSYEHKENDIVTLSTLALPLYFGMVPDAASEGMKKCFKRILLEKGHLAAGEISLPYIIQTARDCGLNDVIAEFILKEDHPSYYAFVKDGLTTLGEYWEENPRSHCHDMMGHIIEWYYNGMAGIIPLEPGFKKILIKPYMPKSVDELDCQYESASGMISVKMQRENEKIKLKIATASGIEVKISTEELQNADAEFEIL